MDHNQRVQEIMRAMSQGRVAPLLEAMAEEVTCRWMGVNQWSRTFEGKQIVVDTLFEGATEHSAQPPDSRSAAFTLTVTM